MKGVYGKQKMSSFGLIIAFTFFLVLISISYSTPTTFSFSGSTQQSQPNTFQCSSVDFFSDNSCAIADPSYCTAFNITIDQTNSSFYFVRGQGFNDTYDSAMIEAYIYTDFNVNSPCSNLYENGQLVSHVTSFMSVYDGVNLVPGVYTVVFLYYFEMYWALQFSPADVVLDVQPGGLTFVGPPYFSSGSLHNCSVNEGSSAYVYNSYFWTQPTSGWFDIYSLIINSTQINAYTLKEYEVWLSLFVGSLNTTTFTNNSCQSNFLAGSNSKTSIGGLDYVWLNENWNYTIVATIEDIYGQVAIQIVPSTMDFISANSLFVPPVSGTTNTQDCTPSTDSSTFTPWFSQPFTSSNEITIIVTTEPLYQDYFGYFSSQSYLYYGYQNVTLPSPCLDLLQVGSFETNGFYSSIGKNYTIVITNQNGNFDFQPLDAGFHLYILSGTFVNTANFVFNPFVSSSTTTTIIGGEATTSLLIETTTTSISQSTASSTTLFALTSTTTSNTDNFSTTTQSSSTTIEPTLSTTTSPILVSTTTITSTDSTSSGLFETTSTTGDENLVSTTSSSSLTTTTNELFETTTTTSESLTTSFSSTSTILSLSTSSQSSSSSISSTSSNIASLSTTTSNNNNNNAISTTTTSSSSLHPSTSTSSTSSTSVNSGTSSTSSHTTTASLSGSTTSFNSTTNSSSGNPYSFEGSESSSTDLSTTQLTFIIFGSMLGFAIIITTIYIILNKKMNKEKPQQSSSSSKYIEMQTINLSSE